MSRDLLEHVLAHVWRGRRVKAPMGRRSIYIRTLVAPYGEWIVPMIPPTRAVRIGTGWVPADRRSFPDGRPFLPDACVVSWSPDLGSRPSRVEFMSPRGVR